MLKLGFIGAGNMGSAILRGLIHAQYITADDMAICDLSARKLEELSDEFPGLTCTESDAELVEMCDMIVLAVKPQYMAETIEHIFDELSTKSVISIAAGWTVAQLAQALEGSGATYLRVMPNTPAMVGEGMTAICEDTTFDQDDFDFARGIFDAVGRTVVLPEKLFDGVIAISGSSPAYVFMFIDAMADAAVKLGMPRQMAIEAAAQAVMGSAKMVLDTKLHPAVLKDQVCSPGGATICAVNVLAAEKFTHAVVAAELAAYERSVELGKN